MTDGEFDCLPAAAREVVVGGRSFSVAPLTIGQLPAFTRALRPAWGDLVALVGSDGEVDASRIAALIAEHGDTLIEAAAVALRVPPTDLAELLPVEFVRLLPEIVRINADFFVRGLQAAQAAAAEIAGSGAGQTPSSA